jgi:hypothetical protein
MEDTIVKLIGQVGFPIFTAVYLMTRMETQMKKMNDLLTVLTERLGIENENKSKGN